MTVYANDLSDPASHAHSHNPRSVALLRALRQRARRRRLVRRGGVILLITLLMLALFAFLLITYVVATNTSRQRVTSAARTEQTGDSPEAILHTAFLQVIRGPRNPNSPIGAHSLLEDMLGSDSLVLNIPASLMTPVTTAGAPTPIMQLSWTYDPVVNPYPRPTQLPPTTGHYAGRTIMLLNGPNTGMMGRVIGSDFDGASIYTLTVHGLPLKHGATRFLVNGKPFSGTGFGFKPLSFDPTSPNANMAATPTNTRLLDAYYPVTDGANWTLSMQQALLPNHRRGVFLPSPTDPNDTSPGFVFSQYLDPAGPGGANEDYDAADWNNMALSMTARDSNSMETILPSFHRPDLIQYWSNQVAAVTGTPMRTLLPPATTAKPNAIDPTSLSMLRKVVLRPLPWDHPKFTGSNLAMSISNPNLSLGTIANPLISGPWDIDNDNDGEADSIWMDVGLPVQAAPDGRRYKPLVAFLVCDLDGRLNLNAHGNWRHAPSNNPNLSRFLPVQVPFAVAPGVSAQSGPFRLRVGQGYGPAEISLSPIFAPYPFNSQTAELATTMTYPYSVTYPLNANGVTEMTNILGGDPTQNLDGRYGEVQLTGNPRLGGGSPSPGISQIEDPFTWITRSQHPQFRTINPQSPYRYLPTNTSNGTPAGLAIDNTLFGAVWADGTMPWIFASGFGSPPDLDGDGMLMLDLRGRPIYIDYTVLAPGIAGEAAGWGEPNDAFDNQYELDLSLTGRGASYNAQTWKALPSFTPNLLKASCAAPTDAPFTPAELERILRANDADAMTLPSRLVQLAPQTLTNPGPNQLAPNRVRQLLTTDQYDVATPSMAFAAYDMTMQIYPTSKAISGGAIPPLGDASISALVRARLLTENPTFFPVASPLSSGTTQAINSAIKQLLPPDLLMGQKFDINRLLGNGRDDNQNGVVDEPGEYETAWQELYGAPIPFDLNNDGLLDGTANGTSYTDVNRDGIFDARDIPYIDVNGNGLYDVGVDLWATLPRQLLARHLYVLMMLLKDPNFVVMVDLDGNGMTGTDAIPNAPGGFVGVASDADTAYYIAQLAINMVDFRDRDAIMTPFEFDIYPFRKDDVILISPYVPNPNAGTWEVDGFLSTSQPDGTPLPSLDDTLPYRGLVWGCERPELIITETMAMHDRRTRDTNLENAGMPTAVNRSDNKKDQDFDQVRRPLGTIAVELFNPNTPLTVGNRFAGEAPNELYSQTPGTRDAAGNPLFGINLNKLTIPDAAGRISPVWRLATVQPGVAPPNLPRAATLPMKSIDRIVYFMNAGLAAGNTIRFENGPSVRAFYSQPNGFVAPGTYALVAPAANNVYGPNTGKLVTPLGMRDLSGDEPAVTTTSAAPTTVVDKYPRVLVLSNAAPNQTMIGIFDYQYTNLLVNSVVPNSVKPTVAAWVAPLYLSGTNGNNAALLPDQTNLEGTTRTVRFSITEPDNGYLIATKILGVPGTNLLTDILPNNENGYYDATPTGYPDRPYDDDPGNFANPNNINNSDNTRKQLIKAAPYTTLPAVSTIYLQRLANPIQIWDPVANPYIIVDQMPVDLTVYNSEMQTSPLPVAGNEEVGGIDVTQVFTTSWKFDTRRRSATFSPRPNVNVNNVLYQGSVAPGQGNSPAKTTLNDMIMGGPTFMLTSTLGYLNNEYGVNGNNRWTPLYPPPVAFGGQNSIANPVEYVGDPTLPFPWLNWNNRPYVSGKELLLVPSGSPASLLREMTLSQNGAMGDLGVYEPNNAPNTMPPAEFAHLANPFHSPGLNLLNDAATGAPRGAPMTLSHASPNLFRLLDLVHVPSRYTGTVDWIPPTNVNGLSMPVSMSAGAPGHYLHPPFNQVSRFRDPGKVNINTVFDPAIWQGILDERFAGENDPLWLNMYQSMWASRQGSGITYGDQSIFGNGTVAFPTRSSLLTAAAVANLPTIFAKPFRSSTGNSLVPLAQMRYDHAGSDTTEREIGSTLLRPDPTVRAFPMLEAPGAPSPVSGFFKEYVNPAFASTQANPYFAYEEYRRLDNLVTTRSNVYAVWITMGYFEVTPGNTDDPDYAVKYPDGWQLGAELGSDTGDIQRHRAFYIYDRSIPVGFERGENHNVDRGILVQRYIE